MTPPPDSWRPALRLENKLAARREKRNFWFTIFAAVILAVLVGGSIAHLKTTPRHYVGLEWITTK